MNKVFHSRKGGYTVVEALMTIAIVTVLSATVGVFFARMLKIEEHDREEAYIREKLSDICAAYADFISVGTTFSVSTNGVNPETIVKYRQETGGVSLETGVVTRAAYLSTSFNRTNRVVRLGVYSREPAGLECKFERDLDGTAPLMPIAGEMVDLALRPLNSSEREQDADFSGFETSDAQLAYLEARALYVTEDDEGPRTNVVSAGRVVRLWNR